MRFVCVSVLTLCHLFIGNVDAQSQVAAKPIVGLRDNRPDDYALIDARIVVQPGQTLDRATVLIEDSAIIAVGTDIEVPAGFMSIDCTGRTIYPGLIDAWSEVDVPSPDPKSATHWNPNVTPERSAHPVAITNVGDRSKLRSQGLTLRVVAPRGGIIKGGSSAVLLGDPESGRSLLKQSVWQHLQLTVPRGKSRSKYPNSPMGATALVRQAFYDAQWYQDAWRTHRARPSLPRPDTNLALAELGDAIANDTFVIDAANERMALRAQGIANEFSLQAILRGSGREYREVDSIAATGRPILVPVAWPEKPNVSTANAARSTTLQELMHWDLAPENPARLVNAGVEICLTTDSLENPADFLQSVRVAVKRGLDPDVALAALTTTPARLIGVDDTVGRIQSGMLANLVVVDGDLFDDQTKVLETWVAGTQFVVNAPDSAKDDALIGRWLVKFKSDGKSLSLNLDIAHKDKKLTGQLIDAGTPQPRAQETNAQNKNNKDKNEGSDGDADDDIERETVDDDADRSTPREPTTQPAAKLTKVVRESDRMTALVRLRDVDDELSDGLSRLTLVTVDEDDDVTTLFAEIRLPNGVTLHPAVQFVKAEPGDASDNDETDADQKKPNAEEPDADVPAAEVPDGEVPDTEKPNAEEPNSNESDGKEIDELDSHPSTEILYPLGAYGRTESVAAHPTTLFRGATLWTCEQAGIIQTGDVLIHDGKIAEVGEQLIAPRDCQIIDCRGKHITPGLIDCHSHMGTDGGVNESGQAVTAEVRIGDFIDNSDINIYRQLAGGLTIANVLHGSAVPIGGQNQVIKLRWGQSMDGLRMNEAPAGIKFALGENVKRNESRYPNTRMGVQQIIRDQLLAARQYDAAWRRWRSGQRDSLPPRRDLQAEAMSEVQRGERWIHCHSYRQDEIVATLDVLDEFGIQIGTLQHILEGYKVADRIAQHGATASAFSDWWAYKFEVFDAIPYNGVLMHQQGIVVSFNSDDRELARHLNTEAAKAIKYGGLSEEEALKFGTLNPAKQLRIDDFVGSITVGKHADLVIWNGPPLSTLSRCEQTWIDGQRYFDRKTDALLRQRDQALHARLVQKVMADNDKPSGAKKKEVAEEDRWARHDTYCGAHGQSGHVHTNWERGR
ncbi:MAG: amidohydrolase family protein [Pirellulaceae bacterium]|nr:amidohydrolase family protein [Pirellulaceae bacterium]